MKTAISVPDDLFEQAEHYAQQRGLSRSELYATALRLYLERHQDAAVTAQLNTLYAAEPSQLDPALERAQQASLPREEW